MEEIFRRLRQAPAASSFEEAYRLLCFTIDQVEDELSGLPNEPDQYETNPRIFAPHPQMDRMSSIAGGQLKRFDNLRHLTYIAANGAIEIRGKHQVDACLTKAGSDGRSVCDICPALINKNL